MRHGATGCELQWTKSNVATFATASRNNVFNELPPVLWRCWLGSRKGIRPVINCWVVGCWRGYLSGDADLHMVQLMPLPLTVSASVQSRLVWLFWYRLFWAVLVKRPLNMCVCVCVRVRVCVLVTVTELVRMWQNEVVESDTRWRCADLSPSISLELHKQSSPNFPCMLHMAMVQSSSGVLQWVMYFRLCGWRHIWA